MGFTAQEIFDKVVTGLAAQGAPSERKTAGGRMVCAYRGEQGRKCAVGHVLDDWAYSREMEGLPVGFLLANYANLTHLKRHKELLHLLQLAHDSSVDAANLRKELARVAKTFSLSSEKLGMISSWDTGPWGEALKKAREKDEEIGVFDVNMKQGDTTDEA